MDSDRENVFIMMMTDKNGINCQRVIYQIASKFDA